MKNERFFKKCFGFTKIESLILMGVLIIIGVFAFVNIKPLEQIQKGNDARRKSDLKMLQDTLENYYKDNGRYPKYSKDVPLFRIIRLDGSVANWGQQWVPYMTVLPKDPSGAKNYVYYSDLNSGQTYYLYASLDSRTDKELCLNKCPNVPEEASCGGICNYGVTSKNVSP